MTDRDQLDLVALLWEHQTTAENGLSALEDALNPQIDANPNDKLLLELLNVVTDARESLAELRELLATMERRDEQELP